MTEQPTNPLTLIRGGKKSGEPPQHPYADDIHAYAAFLNANRKRRDVEWYVVGSGDAARVRIRWTAESRERDRRNDERRDHEDGRLAAITAANNSRELEPA